MCLRTTIKHFLKLFPEISCWFENKTVTLRHGFLIQLIMKQVEERYISFEASKMAYRDIKNSVDTAKREGIAEGMEKGMELGMNQKALDIARNMLADGVDINLIMKYSGLTQEQIEKLK